MVRQAVAQVLTSAGLRVVVAANSDEIPRALAEAGGVVELLVTDVVMPGKSGVVVASEMRALFPGLGVVLMSGYAEEDLGDLMASPNTRFVGKPFTSAALTQAVEELERARAGRALG